MPSINKIINDMDGSSVEGSLIKENRLLIFSVAHKYEKKLSFRGEFEDLVMEGISGILYCLRKYGDLRFTKPNVFNNYVKYHINKYIYDFFLRNMGQHVTIPYYMAKAVAKVATMYVILESLGLTRDTIIETCKGRIPLPDKLTPHAITKWKSCSKILRYIANNHAKTSYKELVERSVELMNVVHSTKKGIEGNLVGHFSNVDEEIFTQEIIDAISKQFVIDTACNINYDRPRKLKNEILNSAKKVTKLLMEESLGI